MADIHIEGSVVSQYSEENQIVFAKSEESNEKVSEYDKKRSQSQFADQPKAP